MLIKTVRIMLLMEIKKFESNPEMSFEISCWGNQRTGGDSHPLLPLVAFSVHPAFIISKIAAHAPCECRQLFPNCLLAKNYTQQRIKFVVSTPVLLVHSRRFVKRSPGEVKWKQAPVIVDRGQCLINLCGEKTFFIANFFCKTQNLLYLELKWNSKTTKSADHPRGHSQHFHCRSWAFFHVDKIRTRTALQLWFKLAPISPITNPPSDAPGAPFVLSEQTDVFHEGFSEPPSYEAIEKPTVLSTLPVALVVEQTARILEDIENVLTIRKRKIQMQKEEEEEEERLKQQEQTSECDSLTDFSYIKPASLESTTSSTLEEEIFGSPAPKSFIILNNRHGDSSTQPNLSPTVITSNPRSLSSDSGTDYEPFSASSSISPPFTSTIKQANNDFTYDLKTFSDHSDDKIFSPLNLPPFTPSTLPLHFSSIPKVTSPEIRLAGGISTSQVSTASLAKSTPSISTDLVKELQQRVTTSPRSEHKRPLSFQVLRTGIHSGLISIDTYQERLISSSDTSRYKSIPSLYGYYPTALTPSLISSSAAVSSQFTGLLANNKSTFGDPAAIKPIVSAFEYPPYKFSMDLPSAPASLFARHIGAEKQTQSFDDAALRLTTIEKYEKVLEKQKLHLELSHKQQQQADFMSLSLSPPLSRKNLNAFKAMSLWVWIVKCSRIRTGFPELFFGLSFVSQRPRDNVTTTQCRLNSVRSFLLVGCALVATRHVFINIMKRETELSHADFLSFSDLNSRVILYMIIFCVHFHFLALAFQTSSRLLFYFRFHFYSNRQIEWVLA